MSPKAIITLGLCVFACLYAATLIFRTGPIERDLTERTAEALRDLQGWTSVSAGVTSR